MHEIILDRFFRSLEGSGPVDPEAFEGWRDFTESTFVDVPPGDFLLGQAANSVAVPPGKVGLLFARSSLLRCGLAFGSGVVAPGFDQPLVLELGNLNKYRPIRLYVEKPVANLLVLDAFGLEEYAGRYARRNPMQALPGKAVAGRRCTCRTPNRPYTGEAPLAYVCQDCGGVVVL